MSTSRTLASLLTVAVLTVPALSGCSSDDSAKGGDGSTTTATTAAPGPDLADAEWSDQTADTAVTVQARDNIFVKPYIEVKAGTTVTFTNRGRNQHNVLAVPEDRFESIEADDLEPGSSQDVTFTAPGDYPYYCSLHGTATKWMVGAVRVVE